MAAHTGTHASTPPENNCEDSDKEEERFYAWGGAEPLMNMLHRIAGHAEVAFLTYRQGNVDWFDEEAFKIED